MKKNSRTITIAAVVSAICLASAPTAWASASTAPGQEEPGNEARVFEFLVPHPDLTTTTDESKTGDTETQSKKAAAICLFVQRVDLAHISSSPGPRAVQSHGNWDNSTCSYALADVKTQLDKRNFLGLYYAVGVPGSGRLAPNPKGLTSGGAGRVTARYECSGTGTNSFRSWTSIDIVGYADAPNKVYSNAIDRDCG